jgi:predicted permease
MEKSGLGGVFQDLRFSFRAYGREPGFAAFAIAIVALGVAGSTTVFSVVEALLLRPLPFRDPQQLVWIANRDTSGLSGQTTQVGHLLDLRAQNRSFAQLGAYFAFYGVGDTLMTGRGEPERLSGVPVSDNFFQTLGVEPAVGRLFTGEECKPGGPKAVLLGYGLWTRRFAADRGVVGRTLILNGEPVTVAGVLPASFDFATVFAPGSRIDLYFPFPLSEETNRWGNTMAIVGRLKPGAGVAEARAELQILAQRITQAHPERNSFEGHLWPLDERVSGRFRSAFVVLACAIALVMLIVCANLSSLLLARATGRRKEIAIRAAMGASRGRLVRQMLTEGLALSLCGAVLGAALAVVATRAVAGLDSMGIPLLRTVRVDAVALAFTLATAVVCGILFGLAPALQAGATRLHDALKDANRGSTAGASRWAHGALVVSEIAFACVLVVAAGLLVRSFLHVLDVNAGFHPERAAAVRVDPQARLSNQAQLNAYVDDVLRRARSIPGIEAAGLTDALPLGRNRSWGAGVKGQTYPKGKFPSAFVRVVSDGYLGAMGIPLRAGRDFDARDAAAAEPVIIINETMARTLFPGGNALGGVIRAAGERRVVGVVGDVRHLALEQEAGNEMYLPIRQGRDYSSLDLVMRSSLPSGTLVSAVREALRPIAPDLPQNDFRILRQLIEKAVSPRRFIALLLGGFALFALALASFGIYAVISYSVGQRTQEIGIRMALGATAGNLQAGIVRQTLQLAAVGIVVGAAASWAVVRSLSGLLYGVTSTDPVTFAGAVAVLTTVAAIAGFVPARRAASVDPSVALRAG